MAKSFTLKNPKAMGENDPQYGQSYWSYTHDGDMPVMFNLMDGEVGDGSVITAEEWVNKESSKGTEYMRLKKVKVQGQQTMGEVRASTAPSKYGRDDSHIKAQWAIGQAINHLGSKKDSTLEDVEKLAGALFLMADRVKTTKPDEPKSLKEAWDKTTKEEEVVVMDIGDEPINLDDIPF